MTPFETLIAALQRIANHPHNSYTNDMFCTDLESAYKRGIADGHRCAANIAFEAIGSVTENKPTCPNPVHTPACCLSPAPATGGES